MFRRLLPIVFLLVGALCAAAQVRIAHISDTHIGLKRAPQASQNLRRVVEMVNARRPDAVIVTGDIGERPEAWGEARAILSGLRAPVYYVPGNHDVNSRNVERYRAVFTKDYYHFRVKGLIFYALNSQLLGNYDVFEAREPQPLPQETRTESVKMFAWLERAADGHSEVASCKPRGGAAEKPPLVFAMQHVPISRAGGFPNDPKPYWTTQEPYRSRELELLRRLGVKHVFLGHWHKGMVYQADGLIYHVAPATSWSPFGAPLGFAMHTISEDGQVKTDFVYLD